MEQRPLDRALSRRQVLKGGLAGASGMLAAGVAPALAPALTPAPAGRRAQVLGTTSAAPGPPDALTAAGLPDPIGVGTDDVTFGWHVVDSRRGARQQAYRIVVWRPPTAASDAGAAPVAWDSGRVISPDQTSVPYGGPSLAPDARYHWTVQTWDSSGAPGPVSAPAAFETGLRDGDWVASWVTRAVGTTPEPDQYTHARAEFVLPSSPIVRARAYVSADQQYELSLNGTRVGKGQAYSYPDTMYYETLDVTGALRPGARNAVGLLTYWDGPTKGHPAGSPGAIVQVSVHHADGSVSQVVTDGTWRVRKGAWAPGTQRDLEGDQVDFTEHIVGPDVPVGWDTAGFDDRGWAPALVLGPAGTAPWRHLVSVRTRVVEQPMTPVSVTTLASGAVVADLGRVVAAVPTVTFRRGTAGRTVTMHAGYLVDEPSGEVSTTRGTQHTDMSYSYVQRGGAEEFHPFDYLGFRYFQVHDPGEPLTAGDLTVLARHAAVPDERAAAFTCSDPRVDAVFELARHSALFSAQEQFVDTPTREKGPWLWDGCSESQTAMAAFGEQNLTRKSLLEFAASQARYWPHRGAVNKIYPTGLGALDINEFTEIYAEWVWQYWLRCGDRALVRRLYPVLANIAGYVARSIAASTGLVTSLPATNVYYAYPVVTRVNVLGVNVFRITANVAELAGRPRREVARHRRRQAALTAAVNAHLTRADGVYVDGLGADGAPVPTASQDANACALTYRIVPAAHVGAVAAHVARLGMAAEPRTAAEVVKALGLAGRDLDVVARLTDAAGNGWANILARGGTFTWEVWQPSDANGDSMSHGWGSNVLPEIQRFLLGVHPTGPGFETFDVVPPRRALAWAQGTVPTPRGPVTVAWRRPSTHGGTYTLDVTVPPNSTATVVVPGARVAGLSESGIPARRAAGVRSVAGVAGGVALRAGAGTFHFQSAPTGR